jgi:hypothetical protein
VPCTGRPAAVSSSITLDGRLPGRNFRQIDLADGYQPHLEIVTGILARKGERQRYAKNHPLNLLWNAFTQATPRPAPTVLPG